MTKSYDGIVVGAGIMGAMAAMQLASAGAGRLLVLEKGPGVGFGSTGKSSAIFRQTYSHYETCLMAHESLRIMRNWGDFMQLPEPRNGFRGCGVVFLFPQGDPVAGEALKLHAMVGVKSELLDSQGRLQVMPEVDFCAVPLHLEADSHDCGGEPEAILEPEGGYADPVGTTEDVLQVARGLGVEVRFNTRVTEVLQTGGRVSGVQALAGSAGGGGAAETLHAPLLINCAGPWAAGLNALAGVPLAQRIVPVRAQKVAKRHPERLKKPLPVINDLINGFNLRPGPSGSQIFLSSFREKYAHEEVPDPDEYNDSADPDFRDEHLLQAHHRVPAFHARGEISGYSGLYTMNLEDNHPVIDETELEGMFVACGFSGHGFKLSPVVGMLLAQKVMGQWGRGKTGVPLDFFSRSRAPLRSSWGGFFS